MLIRNRKRITIKRRVFTLKRVLIAFLAGFIILSIFAGATGVCPFLHRLMEVII